MRRWRIQSEPGQAVPVWLVAQALEGVGTDDLAGGFLRAMRREVAVNHCTIFALDDGGRANVVSVAGTDERAASETALEYLRHGFDRQDSNMTWLAARKTPRQPQAWMSHQTAEEVGDAAYWRVCYGENGLRERVSVLMLLEDGRRLALSFYRGLAAEPFAEADLRWVWRCAPLLMSAVVAHLRKSAALPRLTPLRERLLAELPRREREVISHVLEGRSTKEVAAALGLSATTVLTYRYRAFAKLGVRNHRELLALVERGP